MGVLLTTANAQSDPPAPITAEDSGRVEILTLLVQHTDTVTKIGFTPHGSAFYSAGFDGQFCVWNGDPARDALGELYFCVTDYIAGANTFAWSLDEKRIAITGDNGTSVRLFSVTRPRSEDEWNIPDLTIFSPTQSVVLTMQFTSGGLLASDTNDTFSFYDVRSGDLIRKFEGIEAVVSPDGAQVALLDFDGRVIVIDGQSGEIIEILDTTGTYTVVFSPDNTRLATVGADGTQWWQHGTNGYTRQAQIDQQPQQINFSPDSQFVVTWEDESVQLWDLDGGLAGELPEHAGGVSSAQFTADMTRAVTIDSVGSGRIWRINEDGSAERLLLMRDEVDRAYLSPDSTSAIMGRIEFFARFYDIQRGQLRGQYTMPPDSEISPDWTLMATVTNNIITWHALPNDPRPLAFPPIAVARDAINIRQTPSTEFARIATIPAADPIFAIGRTEDNQWLQVVLPDGTVGWTFISTSVALQGAVADLPIVSLS